MVSFANFISSPHFHFIIKIDNIDFIKSPQGIAMVFI